MCCIVTARSVTLPTVAARPTRARDRISVPRGQSARTPSRIRGPRVARTHHPALGEAAGAARRIQYTFIVARVEDLDDEPNGAARREILAAVAAQVGADDLLMGGAFYVAVDAGELVLRQLRDPEPSAAPSISGTKRRTGWTKEQVTHDQQVCPT